MKPAAAWVRTPGGHRRARFGLATGGRGGATSIWRHRHDDRLASSTPRTVGCVPPSPPGNEKRPGGPSRSMTIPGRVTRALRCSYAPMPSTSNAPPSGRATSSKRRRCRRAGAEAQGAPPDQILAIERQLGHQVDHRVDRTGGRVTPVEVRYGLHVHPRWHVPDLCDTHVRRHVGHRRSPRLAADGSVSKRRWLSLSRPSGHRAGNRASFPDGRKGALGGGAPGIARHAPFSSLAAEILRVLVADAWPTNAVARSGSGLPAAGSTRSGSLGEDRRCASSAATGPVR